MERRELDEVSGDDVPGPETNFDDSPLKHLVDRAANEAIEKAQEVLGEAWGDGAQILVVIDQIDVDEGQQDSTASASVHGRDATIGDVLAMLIHHSMVCAKAAGKKIDLIAVPEEGPPT